MDRPPSWLDRLRARRAERRKAARIVLPTRSQQELCETAMALLTLWVSYDDTEHEAVARTTRSLLSGLSTPDLGYLVLHLTGLTRGLVRTIGAETDHGLDVNAALQNLARGIHERGASGRDEA